MEKLCYGDGEKIGVFDGETVSLYESEYILHYREYAQTRVKNDEWKFGGDGARFRGDYDLYNARREETVEASVNGVAWQDGKVLYSFTVNGSSGVYRKDVGDKKSREEHILSTSDEEILSLSLAGDLLAVTVRRDGATSSVGTLDLKTSELRTLTEGDARDADPCFSPREPNLIYFDSAGVGRNAQGEFTGSYAPAAICALDLDAMEIKEAAGDKKCALVKPKFSREGELYYIKRPNRPEKSGNIFVDILLFPFRILKAIFGFLQAFVAIFGHTSLTSQTEGGENPARGRKTDARKLWLDGALLDADREYKRNAKKQKGDAGFIPMSWKLVKRTPQGEETIKSGVCDYALCKDGGVYCTNGRHIFYVKDGVSRKIADAEKCLCLATESVAQAPGEVFAL